MTPLIYIAGPYRAETRWEVEQNTRAAEAVGVEVARLGAYPVIPHANTRGYFEGLAPDALWLEGTMRLLERCDGAVFVRGWRESPGAIAEHDAAARAGMPFADLDASPFDARTLLADFLDVRWADRPFAREGT